MKLATEVIADLWPAYLDGTASDATRRLIDDCLADEPELRSRLMAAREQADATGWSPAAEARLLEEIRWKLRSRTYLVAAAMALGVLLIGGMLVGGFLLTR